MITVTLSSVVARLSRTVAVDTVSKAELRALQSMRNVYNELGKERAVFYVTQLALFLMDASFSYQLRLCLAGLCVGLPSPGETLLQ